MTEYGDQWDDDPEPHALTVWASADGPEVVGTILGPDGEPLHTVTRPRPPFGFNLR